MIENCDQEIDLPNKIQNKRPIFRNIRNYFREYCNCTSIHGFRYFGEKRTIFERVWWFFIFMLCLAGCAYSIYTVYKKWEQSPVIVSFSTKETPIYSIPFPAVTICPESKSNQSLFNYTNIMQKKEDNITLTNEEKNEFEYMSMVCSYKDTIDYENNETFSNEIYDVIDKVKSPFIVFGCKFLGMEIEDCDQLFTPIFTDVGVCLSFNILDRSEIFRKNLFQWSLYHKVNFKSKHWEMDQGYSEQAGIDPYPKRALLSGIENGFSFKVVTFKKQIDYACTTALQGYRVVLHTPMRLPRPYQQYFRIPLNQAIMAAVQPSMILTSYSVKMYNPRKRECYFSSERYLKYFKIYSQINCQLECLTNYTLHLCDCVSYFMPRENDTVICGTGSIECMKEAETDMLMNDLRSKLNKPSKYKKVKRAKSQIGCDCFPLCTDLTYNVETSQTDWDWMEEFKSFRINRDFNYSASDLHFSSLQIFFKSSYFIASERNELYGPTDFLANFGGLLGLFTGFSILSFMEIIYFLSVRLVCNSRLYGYWAGPDN